MSTEHQQYSIANQSDVIRQYAQDHKMQIVRTYNDAGKSGLTLQRRNGLRELLSDVEAGSADYSAILVYDVSRWGRFQDVDESAYYEYRCKRAKISVHYCAELFVNDGSVSSALLKAIKRTMAGEYSRELSVKVFAGKCRLVESGFRGGGAAGYGLRRLLIDHKGAPKGILKRGEAKSIATDRVVQIPGPLEEIETVHEIYQMYIQELLAPRVIASRLNERRLKSEFGGLWTREIVLNILTNPKYIGANVTNRKSYKLGSRGRANPRERWICRENTFEPIVDADTFRKAQSVAAVRSKRYSNQELLDRLTTLLDRKGKLSIKLIEEDPDMPSSSIFQTRFGSIYEAYRRVGYAHGRSIPVMELARKMRAYRGELLNMIATELIGEGAIVRRDLSSGLVTINDEFTLRLATAPCAGALMDGYRWVIRLTSTMSTDITVVARMTPSNDCVQDYYILPRTDAWSGEVTVAEESDLVAGVHRFNDISFLKALVRRTAVKETL